VIVLDGEEAFVFCADGEPGDPCESPDECASMSCEEAETPQGVRDVCT
jgi:hypothetical protein